MSWNRQSLGHGVGLRSRHHGELLERGASGAAWFEVISENYFEAGGRPWAVLDRVGRDVPIVMHGVSLGVGNADSVSDEYLAQLRNAIHRIEPAWVSDHLCWGGVGGHYARTLLRSSKIPQPARRATSVTKSHSGIRLSAKVT